MTLVESLSLYLVCTLVIGISGTFLTRQADQLADLTGLGEALMGAIFLGAVTSLSGITTSVTAAAQNHPELSVSNAIGGIAMQTFFLAIADVFYKKANLEHASASFTNLMQAVFLIALLAFVAFLSFLPQYQIAGIHPGSISLILIYFLGQKLISRAGKTPMWNPVKTIQTQPDQPDPETMNNGKLGRIAAGFVLNALIIAGAGFAITRAAIAIAEQTPLSESIMGALFTSLSTSLPELVVAVSAVRQGALTLAVSNIIGGNTFDVLFLVFADLAFASGSLYHAFNTGHHLILMLSILLTSVLLLGLLHRQKEGMAGVGWESVTILVLFLLGYGALFYLG